MSDEKLTQAQEVSNLLAEAMFKATNAKGLVIGIALENGAVMTMACGDFVVKLGLYLALKEKAKETWRDADDMGDE